jgi:hypothetical protein
VAPRAALRIAEHPDLSRNDWADFTFEREATMSLGSALMAAATGALQGRQTAQDRAEQQQENNLRLLSVLSQLPGFSIGDLSGSQSGSAPVEAPTIPTAPANAPALAAAAANPSAANTAALPSILQGARAALGPNASAMAPARAIGSGPPQLAPVAPLVTRAAAVAAQSPAPAPPAPSASPAAGASPAPRSLIHVGHLALGGSDEPILFDPTRSASALERAREALNQQAYQALEAQEPGSQGVYDPRFDYQAARRTVLQQQQLADALTATGKYTAAEAALYARNHIDLQDRELKQREMVMKQQQLAQQATELRQRAAQQAFEMGRQRAQDTQTALESTATDLLDAGVKPSEAATQLRALYPHATGQEVIQAMGKARVAAAMRAAVIGQKDRSNRGGGQNSGLAGLGIHVSPDGTIAADSTPGTVSTAPSESSGSLLGRALHAVGNFFTWPDADGGALTTAQSAATLRDTTGGRDLTIGTSPTQRTPTGPGSYTAADVEMQAQQALANGAPPQAVALRRQQLLDALRQRQLADSLSRR